MHVVLGEQKPASRALARLVLHDVVNLHGGHEPVPEFWAVFEPNCPGVQGTERPATSTFRITKCWVTCSANYKFSTLRECASSLSERGLNGYSSHHSSVTTRST